MTWCWWSWSPWCLWGNWPISGWAGDTATGTRRTPLLTHHLRLWTHRIELRMTRTVVGILGAASRMRLPHPLPLWRDETWRGWPPLPWGHRHSRSHVFPWSDPSGTDKAWPHLIHRRGPHARVLDHSWLRRPMQWSALGRDVGRSSRSRGVAHAWRDGVHGSLGHARTEGGAILLKIGKKGC